MIDVTEVAHMSIADDVADALDPRLLEPANRVRPCMTAAQIALLLQVSKMTIYRLMDAGEITYYRVGNSRRIKPNDFLTFLARGRREARA